MKNFIFYSSVFLLFLSACTDEHNAQTIVNKSIAFYGMNKLDKKTVSFDFRNVQYKVKMNGGDFFYERSFTDDSLGQVKDQLSNHGFAREVNGLVSPQTEQDSLKYAASLNSVIYFALLPLKLNDEAVHKKYLRTVAIKGKNYDQIEVSFDKENGGTHHDDVFYFWFDADDHSMDYFAYSAGGERFRALNGLVSVGDIYLQNYLNFENQKKDKNSLADYYKLYEQDKLTKLSEITISNLKVSDN